MVVRDTIASKENLMKLVSCDCCAVVLDTSKIPQTAIVDSNGYKEFIHPAVKQVSRDEDEYQLIIEYTLRKNDIMLP